jgi:hypothetical protein
MQSRTNGRSDQWRGSTLSSTPGGCSIWLKMLIYSDVRVYGLEWSI